MAKLNIYCEGDYDTSVLEKITDGLPPYFNIQPLGGKKVGGAIDTIEKYYRTTDRGKFVILFRDRDFDVAVPQTVTLAVLAKDEEKIQAGKVQKEDVRTLCTYRTTIENYFFDTQLFFEFINQDAKRQQKYAYIKTEQDIKQVFIDSAKKISYYQAVRHTLGKMRDMIDIGATWTIGSGNLPTNLSNEACRQEALIKIQQETAKVSAWTEVEFDRILGEFLAKFDATFFENFDFLVYFQGKDFAKAITKFSLPQFDMDRYYKYALERFDYRKFPDLLELRKIIEDKLAL